MEYNACTSPLHQSSSRIAANSGCRNYIAKCTFLCRSILVMAFLFAPVAPVHAGSKFTHEECRALDAVSVRVLSSFPKKSLISSEFMESLFNFITPDGKYTCDGPNNIIIKSNIDAAALTAISIAAIGINNPGPIDLEKRGLKALSLK